MWAVSRSRPEAPKLTAYGDVHVLTAAGPATGRSEELISPHPDVAVVRASLDGLSATILAGVYVGLDRDRAGYDTWCRIRAATVLAATSCRHRGIGGRPDPGPDGRRSRLHR